MKEALPLGLGSRVRNRAGVFLLWLMAALAVPVWLAHDSSAWDLRIYGKAQESLRAGHDPYTDATDVQKQHHAKVVANGGVETDEAPPYSYVYSPVTLPLLQALDHVPVWLLVPGYWVVYVAGALTAVGVMVSLCFQRERAAFLYIAGVAVFFPGLLANGTVLSGNIAYILYGFVLFAAWRGWRTGHWLLFYVLVAAASCVKAPLLSLVLIPAFSARRQWIPTLLTATAGVALFAGQPLVWPTLFKHYLEAVELQFRFNRDFGCSPAGLLSQALYHYGVPYSPEGTIFYGMYAVPLLAILFYLSQRYLRGDFPLKAWAPVLLLGVILLNPRIMEYDVAPITVAMAIVCWRVRSALTQSRWSVWFLVVTFLVLNAASLYSWELRKAMDGPLLSLLFCGGCWMLMRQGNVTEEMQDRAPLRTSIAS